MDQDALTKMKKDFPDARILRDDGEGWLLEVGQYDSEQAAQDAVCTGQPDRRDPLRQQRPGAL